MPFRAQPSQVGAGVPEILDYVPEATAVFEKGALMALNAGEAEEHAGGTTVTGVLGISLDGTTAAGVASSPSGESSVAIANRRTRFIFQAYDAGAPITDASAVAVNDIYGLIKHSDNVWYVDLDDTTNDLVQVVKVILPNGPNATDLLLVKFLESTLEIP